MAARFNPAPGWPSPPEGWLPPAGWRPDPSWVPAPAGWPLVVHDDTGFADFSFGRPRSSTLTYSARTIVPTRTRSSRGRLLHLLRSRPSH